MGSGRRRRAVAGALVVAFAALVTPAAATDGGPTVIDPLEGEEAPSQGELAESIRDLDPQVRSIEAAEPRSLREEREEDHGTVVSVASDVLFAFDSAELSARAEQTVRDVAADLPEDIALVEVVGHTDSAGTDAYNQDLSERRAEAVAAVLIHQLGAEIDLRTAGRGSQEPVAEESEEEPGAAARNRRVEITWSR
jgi:outer membrane protein OmpA-like peptidoglycan-associated protein